MADFVSCLASLAEANHDLIQKFFCWFSWLLSLSMSTEICVKEVEFCLPLGPWKRLNRKFEYIFWKFVLYRSSRLVRGVLFYDWQSCNVKKALGTFKIAVGKESSRLMYPQPFSITQHLAHTTYRSRQYYEVLHDTEVPTFLTAYCPLKIVYFLYKLFQNVV